MDTLFYLAIAPTALILYYVYKKDPHKEPTKELAKAFFWGVGMIIPVFIAESILINFFPTDEDFIGTSTRLFFNIFVAIGFSEEIFKWLAVIATKYNSKHFDETFDAIVYCVFASLGFATFENLMYVFMSDSVGQAFFVALFRFFTAVPGHAVDAVLMGAFVAKAKTCQAKNQKGNETYYLFLSLLIPIIEHTIYDFLLSLATPTAITIWFAQTIAVFVIAAKLIKKSSKENMYFLEGQTESI